MSEREGVSAVISVFALVVVLITITFAVQSCGTVEKYTSTRTYVATSQQLDSIKKQLGVEDCPHGTEAIALTVESSTGGATVTVRCQ